MSIDDAFRVEYVGLEREPIVIIDDFTGHIEELEAIGRRADYQPVDGFPGIRCRISSTYMTAQAQLLHRICTQCFGHLRGAKVESCSFSLVSKTPEELTQGQRRPHFDSTQPELIALLHYVSGSETGGTAFYRHRRTGFETILPERASAFDLAVKQDEQEFGQLPASYFYGDDQRYEMIGEVAAMPDRAILYRGRLLHSGHIPIDPDPVSIKASGRLTINTFLLGLD